MAYNIHTNYLPFRLTKEEQDNPLLVMDDLYRNQTVFPVWRQDLYIWFKGIFSTDPVWTGNCPANMLYDLEQLERLIEAAWLLHLQGDHPTLNEISDENILPVHARHSHLMKYWKWDFYPRWLNEEEIKQPELVLTAFFAFSTLPQWREKMYEWLKMSLSVSPDDVYYDALISYELLNKLLEATHLLYVCDLKKHSRSKN